MISLLRKITRTVPHGADVRFVGEQFAGDHCSLQEQFTMHWEVHTGCRLVEKPDWASLRISH